MSDLKMPQLNSLTIVGRLVHTPKFRKTDSGTTIASLSIAVDKGFGDKKQSSFFDCVAFNKTAELIEKYMAASSVPVIIEGQIQQRKWDDKEGNKREKVEIVIDRIQRLDWADKDGKREQQPELADDESPL